MFRLLRRTLVTLSIGVAIGYFWDPERGEERRAKAQQQIQDLVAQGNVRVQELRNSAYSATQEAESASENGTTPHSNSTFATR